MLLRMNFSAEVSGLKSGRRKGSVPQEEAQSGKKSTPGGGLRKDAGGSGSDAVTVSGEGWV